MSFGGGGTLQAVLLATLGHVLDACGRLRMGGEHL